MHSLSIFGTSSDAGKSTISFALTYLLHHRGLSVAPFKAQNVSNNSQVCDFGGEIAQPQFFAAESIDIPTSSDMNPVLLKSGKKNSASLIINGFEQGQKDVKEYYHDINLLKPIVSKAFTQLLQEYETIVAEGAGSPVELNLMEKDLSNIFIANEFNTKIVLVADIERGGVFASIWGVYNLLPKNLQSNVIGVIVNKFRGDITLFEDGVKIIENQFKIPVLGVVPYKPLNLGFEDSQSLINYAQDISQAIIKVGVIHFNHMSNFTDFEPLIADTQIELLFITTVTQASSCDMIILPGTKATLQDLAQLKSSGLFNYLLNCQKYVVGICGGYQMMFETIVDTLAVESYSSTSEKALGIFQGEVIFQSQKVVQKGLYNILNMQVQGYEIHNGFHHDTFLHKENFYGTFIHGLFDNDNFRNHLFKALNPNYIGYNFTHYKKEAIKEFTKLIEQNVQIDKIINKLTK